MLYPEMVFSLSKALAVAESPALQQLPYPAAAFSLSKVA